MLDEIYLTITNHMVKDDVLFFRYQDLVFKIKLVNYLNREVKEQLFLYLFIEDENKKIYLGFYDETIRDLFALLLTIKSVGLKTAQTIIENFDLKELKKIVETYDYEKLTTLKGIGLLSAKTIIESLQKEFFSYSYTPREEKILLSLTRLGYPRGMVQQTMKTLDRTLDDETFLNGLLTKLGKQTQLHA